ncbi:MAG: hypothetical protein WAW61_01920 [Methylococcaceae bacterium]
MQKQQNISGYPEINLYLNADKMLAMTAIAAELYLNFALTTGWSLAGYSDW